MCGIAGIISARPISAGALRAMTRSLAHRGPDGEGLFVIGECEDPAGLDSRAQQSWQGSVNIGLGHRRLAILDLSPAGHQPMGFGGRYWITYNGEVYNYLELRRELEADGYTFSTATDTEVILAAYDRWGDECVGRFNGMWAFCIVDLHRRWVFLARDRLGVKPLYFWRDATTFAFASEIKALLMHPQVCARANEDYCRRYLISGADESSSETAFDRIERLPAATFVSSSADRFLGTAPQLRRYWSIQPDTNEHRFCPEKAETIAAELRSLLEDAVRLRLRSDVPVGSALSGGLDSSGIVSLANGLLRKAGPGRPRQMTFSSVYPDPASAAIDESRYIELLAETLEVESRTVTPRVEQVIDEYDSMIYAMDTPPDGTCMSGWFTFKLVACSPVSVTLEGQGADELLAGYVAYHGYWLAHARHGFLRHGINAMRNPGARPYVAAGLILGLANRLGLAQPIQHVLEAIRPGFEPYLSLNQRLARDTRVLLATLLHYGDRASMAHGIESRMPYVDYRVVEFCASIPACYKLHDGWTKYIARRALQDDLPAQVTWRRDKLGWPSPDMQWMKSGLARWARQRIADSAFVRAIDSAPLRPDEEARPKSLQRVIRRMNLASWHHLFVERQYELRASGGTRLPGAARIRHPARQAGEWA
jgi:asparagine synthase (glutamine-hydrolysing)